MALNIQKNAPAIVLSGKGVRVRLVWFHSQMSPLSPSQVPSRSIWSDWRSSSSC